MEDEAGPDEKIIVVPVDALHPFYTGVRSHKDLPPILRDQIAHFFTHYKDFGTAEMGQVQGLGRAGGGGCG